MSTATLTRSDHETDQQWVIIDEPVELADDGISQESLAELWAHDDTVDVLLGVLRAQGRISEAEHIDRLLIRDRRIRRSLDELERPVKLSIQSMERVADLIESPPEPSEALRSLWER